MFKKRDFFLKQKYTKKLNLILIQLFLENSRKRNLTFDIIKIYKKKYSVYLS